MSGVQPTEVVGKNDPGKGIVQPLLRVVEGSEALNDSTQDCAVEPILRLDDHGQKLDRQTAGEDEGAESHGQDEFSRVTKQFFIPRTGRTFKPYLAPGRFFSADAGALPKLPAT